MDFILSKILEGDIRIRGGSDDSLIGNTNDALKVSLSSTSSSIVANISNSFPLEVNILSSSHALSRTNDSISAAIATDVIMNNNSSLTPQFAAINFSSASSVTLVSGVTGAKIRVLALTIVSNGQTNLTFRSNITDITGDYPFVSQYGLILPFNPVGWFETAAGEALNIFSSSAQSVAGSITYVEV